MDKDTAIKIADRYIRRLEDNHLNISSAWLFGSTVSGTAHEDSDIDVAFVVDTYDDSPDSLLVFFRFRRDIDLRIEPHPISKSDYKEGNPFISEILRTGIRIA